MKEYIFLQAFYLRQSSLNDIDLLIEHVELQDVKTRLSKDFIRICLCLICYRCDVDQVLWDRLSHPSIKKQLPSLEDAMLELGEKGFLINPALIHLLLDKSMQETSLITAPLSAGMLLEQARELGFLSTENGVTAPAAFQDMDIKKVKLYGGLSVKPRNFRSIPAQTSLFSTL